MKNKQIASTQFVCDKCGKVFDADQAVAVNGSLMCMVCSKPNRSFSPDRSVNCFFCSNLVDERECVPNIEEGGSICPKCQKVREKMKHTYVLILSRVNPSDGQPQIYHTFVFADSEELMALDGEAKDLACSWQQVPRAIITDVIPYDEYTAIEKVLAEAQKQWDGE